MLLLPLLLAALGGRDSLERREAPAPTALPPVDRGESLAPVRPEHSPRSPFAPAPATARPTPPAPHPTPPPTASAGASPSTTLGNPDLPARPPTASPDEGLRAPEGVPVIEGPTIPIPTGDPDYGVGAPPPAEPGAVYTRLIGQVIDQVTRKPLAEVEVSLPELDLRGITDEEGWFMLHGIRVRERPYELLFVVPGYENLYEALAFPEPSREQKTFELRPLGW